MRKALAISLGVLLALVPIHRAPLLMDITLGLTVFAAGIAVWRIGVPKIPLQLFIPATLLTTLMIVSNSLPMEKLNAMGLFIVFIGFAALGPSSTLSLSLLSIVGSLSILVTAIISSFTPTGGIYSPDNYNLPVGVLTMSLLISRNKYQWLLYPIILVGLFFTGASEAIIAIGGVGLVTLLREHWSPKLLPSILTLVLLLGVCTPLGITQKLYHKVPTIVENNTLGERTGPIESSLQTIQLLGHGYSKSVLFTSIHNVPIRILYELGPLGLLAWLWLLGYGVLKTSWKYAFLGLFLLGLFDHMTWTQLDTYTWALFGLCIYKKNESDYVFKEVIYGRRRESGASETIRSRAKSQQQA